MRLQKSAVIESQIQRVIEMAFADQSSLDDAHAYLQFRIPVSHSIGSRLPELQLEALQVVRKIIGEEIRRLDHILGQDHGAGRVSD